MKILKIIFWMMLHPLYTQFIFDIFEIVKTKHLTTYEHQKILQMIRGLKIK